MRILVTGGAGFIGSHLVDKLVQEGCEVVVLDDLSSGRENDLKSCGADVRVEFVRKNVMNGKVVWEAVGGVDSVVHLAAKANVPFSVKHPTQTWNANVYGTKVLLDACTARHVGRFVFASSCAVYGEANYVPIDELHPTNPASPYAESKLAAEQMCFKDYANAGIEIVALRFFNVYGSRQAENTYVGVIAAFRRNLEANRPLMVYGDGLQTRDFVHVSDVVNAIWLALNNDSVGIFNVCSGRAMQIRELAKAMAELTGKTDVEIAFARPREGDVHFSHGTFVKAKDAFGYQPAISLRSGLEELLEETNLARRVAPIL